ncbi:hypothetical protein LEP1GSC041_2644 [Leptospira noguchii str. 2006001870]|uniref:Uncharacterized protein n=1 Tax=Leptospira noguchii serovar Autumnalis str. ZUN142 TaxID=1085540 RepID=M6UJA4_9LEPT|nr:hypothetical protein LEP1GSC041_2644 [Leptospira noguchii str. 2006001870]EMO41139.1 hypothetical protein LEP1GSC186_3074 [Leptospira noguchii serovar Autumnalis str. ZUN142]
MLLTMDRSIIIAFAFVMPNSGYFIEVLLKKLKRVQVKEVEFLFCIVEPIYR